MLTKLTQISFQVLKHYKRVARLLMYIFFAFVELVSWVYSLVRKYTMVYYI